MMSLWTMGIKQCTVQDDSLRSWQMFKQKHDQDTLCIDGNGPLVIYCKFSSSQHHSEMLAWPREFSTQGTMTTEALFYY